MDTIADYNSWKASKQQSGVGAANVVLGSATDAPDQVAGDLNLANEFGKVTGSPVPPAPLVKEYRNIFQQKIEEQKNKTILSNAPRLTEWLRTPENAAVAKDDLSGLSWWETAFGAGGNALSRGVKRVPQSYNQFMADQAFERMQDANRSFGDILSEQSAIRNGKGEVIAERLLPGPDDLFFAGTRYANSRIAELFGRDQEKAAQYYQQQVGIIGKRIADIPMSPAGARFRDDFMAGGPQGGPWNQLSSFATKAASDPGGLLAFLTETAAESLPSIAAAVGVTAATRSPVLGAVALGGQSGIQERYTEPSSFFQSKGIDISTPEGAAKVISDPALMQEAAQRGAIRGLIVGAMDGLSGGVAGKELAASPIGDMVLQSVTQAFMGGAGEAGAQMATNGSVDMRDVIIEALAEFVTAPVEAAGVGGRGFLEDRRKARAAEARQTLFQELSGQAQNSALRNRMPDKFRQFIEAATANGPVENIYVPAEQFVQYFQSVGIDPHELVDGLEGMSRDDLDVAIAGGGDLQIPTATYATKIAGSEHDAFLMENMRFDPDEFTSAEAKAFNERAEDAMNEAWRVAENLRLDEEQYRSSEQQIYDTMVSRLRAAGRSTDVATTEAVLYPAFYRVMAERSGLTTEEFMQRYPLPEVTGERPDGMQLRNVDELSRTLAEARNRRTTRDSRQSLLEFISDYGGINDTGGELRSRDAETVKRGKGKKSLKLARSGIASGMKDMFGGSGKKHGADDVARAAIEAGFLADDPVANEYRASLESGNQAPDISRPLWDAIDRELRGEAQYSVSADPAVADVSDLDKIEEYLSRLGVSLDDNDAAIREALEKARDEEGKKYGQPGLLFQDGSAGPRGLIQFPAGGVGNGDSIIRLFQTADLSTMLHESGHYFLTVMQNMASTGEPQAAGDFNVIKDWWRSNASDVAKDAGGDVTADDVIAALDNSTTGDASKDAAIDVGMQEQFARAFEAYLMEGKSPSSDLRTAFEKFRSWLISIYRRLSGLNVNASPEINAVFDRMLASDQEIADAKTETGDTGPLFATAEEMGLTPDQYDAFIKLRTQAEDEAKARLLRETMAPIKRERDKAFREEKAIVRDEVETEINTYRYYRAMEWMGNRRWLGEGQPEAMPDFRLSKDILIERYGEGVLKPLPRGKQTMYAVDGGLDPDEAAGWFGFNSGDEMVKAMERAPKRNEAIDAETDRVMRERHGDVLNDGTAEAQALDAVHNDKRGQWIAAELKAVIDVAGTGTGMTAKEARLSARHTLSRMRVRDAMNANRFLAAERKAAAEAARLGAMLSREAVWMGNARRRIATKAREAIREEGAVDVVAPQIERANSSTKNYNETVTRLIEVKRRQLLNHALYSEARKVADEVEKAENFVAKLGKKSTRERIAGSGRRENAQIDYLAAIDQMLDQYDFRKLSATAEDRRGALNAYVEAMKAAGRENELSIPDDVLLRSSRAPYKTLSVEELRGVIDTLKNLEHVATRWDKLIDAQQQRELEAVTTDIVEAFEKNTNKRPPGRVGSKREALRNSTRQFFDLVLNATTLLREIDGFEDMGAAYRNLKAPIDAAMNRLIVRKEQAASDLQALYDVYSKAERRSMSVREHMPELGYALSKWERIAVALNTGNAGNFQRLTDPKVRGSLSEDQVNAVLLTLDARDAAFIQSVWDYVGSFRDDIAARERRTTGVEPQWVEASPIDIAGKTLKGGYYPIKYDPRLSSLARDDAAQDIAQSLQAGRFGKAQTRNGHTKERAQSSGRDIELDMSVLHRHINQVVYDLELSEAVSNSWRILQDTKVRGAFMEAGKSADFDALEIWLKDVAEGELKSADLVSRMSRTLKSNFTAAKLAFNLVTVAMQITGLSQSMVVAGKKNVVIGIMKAAASPVAMSNDVAARSPYMATRQTTFNKDIYDFYSDPKTGPVATRWGEIKSEIIGPLSFWLMTKVQWHLVDVPTWIGGYQQGLQKFGNDETKAIAHADDIVKRAQASGLFPDRSAIERGSVSRNARQNDVVRLFTALGSYMFAKFNVAYERSAKAGRTIGQEGFNAKSAQEALSWTLDMTFLFALEAVVTAAIKGQLPGGDDGEDDDGWLKFLAKQTGFSIMGTIPFIRDGASALQGFDGGGAYGGIVGEAAKGSIGTANIISAIFADGDVKKSDVKAIIAGTSLATGIPATQINRIVDAGWRQAEGENVSPLEYILGKIGK
ncbi:hypothetical protein HB779_17350 [Phyllobacterium sp. 628]|uniref:hypothetical protein n=1 Tax=Phyllobacterium sp. 628 TaxID=2718938 RepID=UPI00166230AB|nr:hypothetical protein [Phyllobacterium sp. 628]QND53457.1 hypothetical protein HB779_17350 [Phyllobacterium sp. 628]